MSSKANGPCTEEASKREVLWVSGIGGHTILNRTSTGKEQKVSVYKTRDKRVVDYCVVVCLSLAKLYRQFAIGWLDLVQLVFSLVAYGIFEPGCFVVVVIASRSRAVVSDRLEALVEEVGILVVLGGLLGNFREGVGLRDWNQLPAGDGR